MLTAIDDHENLEIDIIDPDIKLKVNSNPESLTRMEMQASCLVTVLLSDYGLDNIVLKASFNTWFRMSRQGDLFASVHEDKLKCTFDSLEWLPSMYPLLYPLGITGPDNEDRTINVGIEDYVKHQISMKDKRFAIHDTFMFAMYNVIQRRNVAKSLRFAIRGKEMFNIRTQDLKDSLQELMDGGRIINVQVQRLFNKVTIST